MPKSGAELAEEPQLYDVKDTSLTAQLSALAQPQAITTPDKQTASDEPSQVQDNHCLALIPAAAMNLLEVVDAYLGLVQSFPAFFMGDASGQA
jgi:hypothetical protein